MNLLIAAIAIACLALPVTREQGALFLFPLPLPLGQFKFVQSQFPVALAPAANAVATPSTTNFVSLEVVRSSHDTTVIQDYTRRHCIGSVFNAPLGCPCASPGKRCHDLLSKCTLENRCICDATKGYISGDKMRCIPYATTVRTTTRTTLMTTKLTTTMTTTTTTTPRTTTTTTTPTTTTTTRTSTSTTTTSTTTKPLVSAADVCPNSVSLFMGYNPALYVVSTVNLCDTPMLQMSGNQIIHILVPNPMPRATCTMTITVPTRPPTTHYAALYINQFKLPSSSGMSGDPCSTSALQINSDEYCSTRPCPPVVSDLTYGKYILFNNVDGDQYAQLQQISLTVDPSVRVDPTATPVFLEMTIAASIS